MTDLNYDKLQMQPYFKDKRINPKIARNIFKFQTRSSEVKTNFKNYYKDDLECLFADCSAIDSQVHLLEHSDENIENPEEFYRKLFSLNPDDNLQVIRLLVSTMDKRKAFLDPE